MKGNLIRCIIFSVIFCGCDQTDKYPSSCSQIYDSYSYYLERAKNNSQIDLLTDKLKNILVVQPNCFYSNLLLSDINLLVNNYGEAKKYLLKAIEIDSGNVYALFKVGTIYSMEKKYDSAIQYFRYAAEEKTQDNFFIDYNKGLTEVTEKPHFDVEYSEIIFNNALASYYANYLLDARNELDYCIKNGKRLKESYFFRGLTYFKIRYNEKGCSDMNSAKEHGNIDADEYLKKHCQNK